MPKKHATTLSFVEVIKKYPTDEDAVKYFEKLRWGDEPYCTKCGCTGRITKQKNYRKGYWCGDCRSFFNCFTNTPLEHNRVKGQQKWIYAAHQLMTSRKGVSALELKHTLKVSYPTAWYMLHRLRLMCGSDLEAMRGEVEVDETFLGGKERNKHASKRLKNGRGKVGKQPVLGMRERGGKVKAMPIDDIKAKTLQKAIRASVEKGSTVYTDDFPAYRRLVGDGSWPYEYNHKAVKHSAKEYVNGMAHTNGIESVWSMIKRGFNGTYHHWSKKHCQNYVNEFTFRLNEGNVERDTQDRLDDLFRAMVGKTITYRELVS